MDDLKLPSSGWMYFILLFILQHLSKVVSSMPYMGPWHGPIALVVLASCAAFFFWDTVHLLLNFPTSIAGEEDQYIASVNVIQTSGGFAQEHQEDISLLYLHNLKQYMFHATILHALAILDAILEVMLGIISFMYAGPCLISILGGPRSRRHASCAEVFSAFSKAAGYSMAPFCSVPIILFWFSGFIAGPLAYSAANDAGYEALHTNKGEWDGAAALCMKGEDDLVGYSETSLCTVRAQVMDVLSEAIVLPVSEALQCECTPCMQGTCNEQCPSSFEIVALATAGVERKFEWDSEVGTAVFWYWTVALMFLLTFVQCCVQLCDGSSAIEAAMHKRSTKAAKYMHSQCAEHCGQCCGCCLSCGCHVVAPITLFSLWVTTNRSYGRRNILIGNMCVTVSDNFYSQDLSLMLLVHLVLDLAALGHVFIQREIQSEIGGSGSSNASIPTASVVQTPDKDSNFDRDDESVRRPSIDVCEESNCHESSNHSSHDGKDGVLWRMGGSVIPDRSMYHKTGEHAQPQEGPECVALSHEICLSDISSHAVQLQT